MRVDMSGEGEGSRALWRDWSVMVVILIWVMRATSSCSLETSSMVLSSRVVCDSPWCMASHEEALASSVWVTTCSTPMHLVFSNVSRSATRPSEAAAFGRRVEWVAAADSIIERRRSGVEDAPL